jgi:hypothetical protein
VFLNLALVGGEWSASRPGRFTPGERAPGTHYIGGWVGTRTDLDDIERRKILPYRDSDPLAIHPVDNRYVECTILVPKGLKSQSLKLWVGTYPGGGVLLKVQELFKI